MLLHAPHSMTIHTRIQSHKCQPWYATRSHRTWWWSSSPVSLCHIIRDHFFFLLLVTLNVSFSKLKIHLIISNIMQWTKYVLYTCCYYMCLLLVLAFFIYLILILGRFAPVRHCRSMIIVRQSFWVQVIVILKKYI